MNQENKVKKLIFCETIPKENDFLTESGTLIIALKPVVYAHLKAQGVAVKNTLDYFFIESHQSVLEQSEKIVNWTRKNLKFVDFGMGIKNAYRDVFIFWWRFVLHKSLWLTEVVNNAIAVHQPIEILVYTVEKKSVASLYLEQEDGALAAIVRNLARLKNLKCEIVEQPVSAASNSSLKYLFDFIINTLKFKVSRPSKDLTLFTSKSFQMDELAKQLTDRGVGFLPSSFVSSYIRSQKMPEVAVRIFFADQTQHLKQQRFLLQDFAKLIASQADTFSFCGVSLAQIMVEKMSQNYLDYILQLVYCSFTLADYLHQAQPTALVSNAGRFDDLILAELCQDKGIEFILVSHGSHVKPKNKYELIEWGEHGRQFLNAPASVIAIQTPTVRSYFDALPSKAKLVKTGPLTWGQPVDKESGNIIFDKLFQGKFQPGQYKVIVHASTPKTTYSLRPYVYETSDEYIQSVAELAQAVNQIPNTLLIIKFRASKEISAETLRSLVSFSDRVVLSIGESLLDVLSLADLLVSYSSTAIDEALQNYIPVLLYGGAGRYQHIPAYEIKPGQLLTAEAIYHLGNAAVLPDALTKILSLEIASSLFEQYIYPPEGLTPFRELLSMGV